jgi:DNA polymerase IIIc chi subunit
MIPEINFYQVDETIVKSLAPLLLKVLEEKKRALIFCAHENKIKEIDDSLWSYGRNKFIAHATIFDREFSPKRQPILISNKEENSNEADYLVFLDMPSAAFISSFSRAFYFFDEKNSMTAKELSEKLRPKNCYKKAEGKWVKAGF